MNWDFFDIVEEGVQKGYKSKWAVYKAINSGIEITMDDLIELAEIYRHKKLWAYYTAKEFNLAPFKEQTA
jgi:hypothetical protein